MSYRLSTDCVSAKDRPGYWNYLVSDVLGRLETIPQDGRRFRGDIIYNRLSSVVVARVASTQLTVKRPERYIHNPHEDFLKVNFQISGNATLEQGHESVVLRPGDWVIYDNTRPYNLAFHDDYTQMLWLVPRQRFLDQLSRSEMPSLQVFSCQNPAGNMLFNQISSLLKDYQHTSISAGRTLNQMMVDLLLLAIGENDGAISEVVPAKGRLLQVQQFVQMELRNPDLSVEMISAGLHLSKRYIHKLFKQSDVSANRYIWLERIERCRADLANPQMNRHAINEIAFSWGFRSSAHFSRLFKEIVGRSPRVYRKNSAR